MNRISDLPEPVTRMNGNSYVSAGGPRENLPVFQGPVVTRSWIDRVIPYLSIARPDHWFKNVFMMAGILLAYFCYPGLVQLSTIPLFFLGVISVCLLASSNYVLNEILDAPTDRSHPVKCQRPIPAGKVHLGIAYAEWILLGVAGLLVAWTVNSAFFFSGLFLLVMGVIYNVPPLRSKEFPYVDVLSESINNPIRLLLGWFVVTATVFPPISLLVAYWMIGAFFMASKRLAEYRSIGDKAVAGEYRKSFRHYDEHKLLISMFFYITSFALFLGVFIIRYHLELILIFPLVAGFVCFYLHVALKKDSKAQNPEKLYREKGLMIYLFLCLATFFLLMFADIPVIYDLFNVQPSPVPALWNF